MKLLNREPTEEMLRAAGSTWSEITVHTFSDLFKCMYDAAPEIATNSDYSAEQVAALQAENERFRKESEELKNELSECSMVIDNIEPTNKMFATQLSKATGERDELLKQREATILEQQATLSVARSMLYPVLSQRESDVMFVLKNSNLSALEAALKAERIKTLEDALMRIDSMYSEDGFYSNAVWAVGDCISELRRLVNELRVKS